MRTHTYTYTLTLQRETTGQSAKFQEPAKACTHIARRRLIAHMMEARMFYGLHFLSRDGKIDSLESLSFSLARLVPFLIGYLHYRGPIDSAKRLFDRASTVLQQQQCVSFFAIAINLLDPFARSLKADCAKLCLCVCVLFFFPLEV